jgi:hypothetical protein
MELVLISLAVVSLLEIIQWLSAFWRWRRPMAGILIVVLAVCSGLLLGQDFTIWSVIFVCFSLYRIVNLLRIIENRVHGDYLFNVARRSSFILIGIQLLIVAAVGLDSRLQINSIVWLYILIIFQLIGGGIVVSSTIRHLKTTRPPLNVDDYADRDLPTLTVAIPARNETEDLSECLQSLITSNYPKLEILVLDDCSQEKHTPEIIRGFAHDGVRFVAGKTPPERWLAKNYAYSQLAEESNGDLLLFCGVDVRFQKDALRSLVKTMLYKQKSMMGVLPINQISRKWSLESLLVQPAHYA